MKELTHEQLTRHVWEGWRVIDFIEELEWQFDRIMSGHSHEKPFKNKADVKKWTIENQPYHKKNIPEVTEYFQSKWSRYESMRHI